MVDEKTLKEAIGLADACELLAAAAAFPDEALADALSDGRLVADARSCLDDCGVGPEEAAAACGSWADLAGKDRDAMLSEVRRASSLLFVRQGDGVAVWPYESAFLHVEAGRDGEPALFRSSVTLDVEKSMREAGGLPPDARTEPCDSVWDEFMFLSYLFGREAEALDEGDAEAAELFRGRARAFVGDHASRWLPGFFDAVACELPRVAGPESAPALFYGGLCSYGACVMGAVARRVA